jgi:ankyrin repeat protein
MNQEELNERMYEAIETKSTLSIQMLLEQGAEFNSAYCLESTLQILLIDAVFRGHADVVKSIVDTGIDVNFKNDKEISPLHIAAIRDESKIIKMLIRAGADVNMKGIQGLTPIKLNSILEQSKSIQIFLDAIKNRNSKTIEEKKREAVENLDKILQELKRSGEEKPNDSENSD